MTEDLIAQIRAYSQQLAEEMTPIESEEGIPVVVAQRVPHPHLLATQPRWVFALALAIAILLFGLVVSLLRSPQVPPVATSDPLPFPVATTVPSQGSVNGWVAFASYQEEWDGDHDIFLVREGQPARRVIGSDSDLLDQMCPAFSPDGARLAYGQAEGTAKVGYSGAALVISNLDQDGNASVALEIDVGETAAPPCATWSPDGERIALGVHEYVRGGWMQESAVKGDVWVISLASEQTEVLAGMYVWDGAGTSFSDMKWSFDGTELAIANVQSTTSSPISLYSALSGELRPISVNGTWAGWLTWSPDDNRIALQSVGEEQQIQVVEVHGNGNGDYQLAAGFGSFHGIGPVWSPPGIASSISEDAAVTHPASLQPRFAGRKVRLS